MEIPSFKLESEEYEKILFVLSSLHQKLSTRLVFLINRNGQEIGHDGEVGDLDVQALSSLAASNLAATFGLASIIGEQEFSRIYHKGERTSILITPIGEYAFLLFLATEFSEGEGELRSLKQAVMILDDILAKCVKKGKTAKS